MNVFHDKTNGGWIMKGLCFALFLAATVAFPGCGGTPESYYPVKEGAEWSFRAETITSKLDAASGKLLAGKKEGKFFSSFLPGKEWGGKTVYPRKDVFDGTQTSYSYLLKDAEGIALVAEQGADAVEPNAVPQPGHFITFHLGAKEGWSLTGKSRLAKGQFLPLKAAIVSDKDVVQVPAGKFKNCLVLRSEGTKDFDIPPYGNVNIRVVTMSWFAPRAGLIKEVVTEESPHPELGTMKTTIERVEPGK